MDKIPIILLAAGSSSRMGKSKQLLTWGKQSLIEFQIRKLQKTDNPVNVVLGANSQLIKPVIEKMEVNFIVNYNWKNGMGSSIATGIHRVIQQFPLAEGVLITLVDQPLVTTNHLETMLNSFCPGEQQIIVSQSSSGWKGVPVLFDKYYFDDLKKLRGDEGAKSILQQHQKTVISVNCDDILEDVDTPESYLNLYAQFCDKN